MHSIFPTIINYNEPNWLEGGLLLFLQSPFAKVSSIFKLEIIAALPT